MKRFVLAIALAGAVALGIPGAAESGTRLIPYAGSFEPSGVVKFHIKRSPTGRSIVHFKWSRLPLDCENGPETTSSRLNFPVEVERQRFSASAVDDPDDIGSRLVLQGELIGTESAEGTMRIRGGRVPVDQGPRQNCDSGVLSWSATRARPQG